MNRLLIDLFTMYSKTLSFCLVFFIGLIGLAGWGITTNTVRAQVQLQADAFTSGATPSASGSETTLQGSIGQIATGGSQNSTKMLFNGLWGTLYADDVSTDIDDVDPRPRNMPESFHLSAAYPNPFNPSTRIRYALPQATHVTLTVYNMLGKRVQVLVDQQQQAGRHAATFRGNGLSSGMYIYRLQAETYTQTRKMMLVK